MPLEMVNKSPIWSLNYDKEWTKITAPEVDIVYEERSPIVPSWNEDKKYWIWEHKCQSINNQEQQKRTPF